MSGTVAWISIAPVKGLALSQVGEVLVEPFGVRENRRFYLIDETGRLTNAKQVGRLALVRSEYDDARGELKLRFPDGTSASGPVELGDPVATSFYGHRDVEGRVVLGPFAEALSSFAGRALRIVKPDDPGAALDRGPIAAVSLVSVAALDVIARAGGAAAPVDGRRFRMLFGVEGIGAHEEDTWIGGRVRIGEALVELRSHVGRCAVTTQNPDTGEPDFDTLKTIGRYRANVPSPEPLPFGVWGGVVERGRVRLGDAVVAE